MSYLIELVDLSKRYNRKEKNILGPLNLALKQGESVAIWGPSGCGKSTLLKIIGLLDNFSEGQYILDNIDVATLNHRQCVAYRNSYFGFIFQSFFLIPHLTIIENIMLPLLYRGETRAYAKLKAASILEILSLTIWKDQLPNVLSGGQQQRVAIARALVGEPKMILADEPTGALDLALTQQVFELLKHFISKGIALLMVTHDLNLAAQCDRKINLIDLTC